jgi:hypothetical protein
MRKISFLGLCDYFKVFLIKRIGGSITHYQLHVIMVSDLGLEGCIENVWKDTVVYIDNKDPILVGRSYGRVSRHLLHEELLKR